MTKHFIPGRRGIVAVRADASDPKAIFAELQNAFESFKAEHTGQLTDLRKGLDDVVKAEKVDRINSDVSKLQSALDKATTDIAALKVGPGGGSGDEKPGDPEYLREFEAYFREGELSAKVKANKIQAAANKGTPGQGGYLAPIEWDRTITDRLINVSPMRQIAAVQPISTAGYTKLYNMRGTGSGWVGETAARPETTSPQLQPITILPGTIYAQPAATEEILEDAEIDIEAWLTDEVEEEFSFQEGIAFVSGNGVNKPKGFLTYVQGAVNANDHPYGAIPHLTSASATAIGSDEIIDLIYALPQQYTANARFVSNRSSLAKIRKLKDGDGNYMWQPSFQAGAPATLAGYAVTEMAAMPNVAANAFPLAFGDFRRGYQVVDRRGVTVLRDPYSNKPYVMFYMTKRVGGSVVDPDVLRVLKMAAA